jgi:excisionase family DNA binding protein
VNPQDNKPLDLNDPACPSLLKPEALAGTIFPDASRSTIYDWIRQGRIPVVKMSARRYYVPTEALRRMLAGEQVPE